MQQYVIFNVLKEYCIPKEEEGGNNNEKLGLHERLSAGIQFRFRNRFHGKISGNRNFIC
jgi:hypothetical protein